ncbi:MULTISPECIES: hypothetical protein [unclassified Streptomyces]|uniref:hypothetical protein n=1 Tax=unclassified Streptomyces TaxID=2593676 RepID=UPI00344EFF2C
MSAVELAGLAAGPDAVRRLGARRGFLGDTPANRELARTLRERPAEFGWVHPIVLGADGVDVPDLAASRGFTPPVRLFGIECLDGFQRLCLLADALAAFGPEHLALSTVRLEIRCGPHREVFRRLHDTGHLSTNPPTAQDGLIRCPDIQWLMAGDWEKEGFFDPRRGVSAGPHSRRFSMPEVTRGLACLSPAPGPDAVHLAATDEGLERLWARLDSPLYRAVFRERMSPLGVVRAVEAYDSARGALRRLPGHQKKGPGHLIEYAPDLICWEACRRLLPLADLHVEAGTRHDWDGMIQQELPVVTERTAGELVRRYEDVHQARGGGRIYKGEVELLDVWREILG